MKFFLRMSEVLTNRSKVESVNSLWSVYIDIFGSGICVVGSGDGGEVGLGVVVDIGSGYGKIW